MKKTFPLHQPNHAAARVVEAIKGEVRKYVKRERRKKLPETFDQWDFACKVGADLATAETKTVDDIPPAIDTIAQAGGTHVYIEVISAAGHRFPPAAPVAPVDLVAPIALAPETPEPPATI